MSSKEKEEKPKKSLLDMQDVLKHSKKKHVSFKDPSTPTKTAASPGTKNPKIDDQDDIDLDASDDEFVAKHHHVDKEKELLNTGKSMISQANCFDKIFFSWVFDIIKKAQTNTLTLEDFGGLREDDRIQEKIALVEKVFNSQKEKNIFMAIFVAFKWRFFFAFVCIGVNKLIHMSFPVIISEIIRFMQDKEDDNYMYGVQLICLLVVLNIVMQMFDCHGWYNNLSTGCLSNKIIRAMIVKKQLKLTAATSKNYETGQIHSVKGATQRIIWFCWEATFFITTPLWVLYCTIRLFMTIGWTFVVGFSLMVFCWKFDRYFNRMIQDKRHEESKLQEKRMNITSESFENIKTIKFYGWDHFFKSDILKIRAEQIEKQESTQAVTLVLSFVWKFLPNLMAALSFSIFVYLGNTLELPQAIEMIMLFTWIQGDFNRIMNMQEILNDMRLCVRRIQDYLAQEEIPLQQIVHSPDQKEKETTEWAVRIHRQDFSWGLQTQDVDELFDQMNKEMKGITEDKRTKEQILEEKEKKQKKEEELKKQRKMDTVICLKDIDLHIKKGQFVCIIGKVGSGKSSLLSALIGDLLPVPKKIIENFKKGHGWEKELNQDEAMGFMQELIYHNQINKDKKSVEVNGTVAYTQQTPWIRNKTLRENIVYNQPFDYERYVDTVQYCELERDLETLREGDNTLIGEKGVNMSGGQKARMGLARAVYQNKEIYLMDDPISALDAHVRKQIINNVYFGILKDKTRILVTHAIDFLSQADHIVMMDQGKITCQGTYPELNKVKEFQDLMELNNLNKNLKKDKAEKTKSKMQSVFSHMSTKVKSIFEENTESFGVQNDDRNENMHTNHDDVTHGRHDKHDFDCASCSSASVCLTEEEDSEMDDDYDPLAVAKGKGQPLPQKVQSSLSLKKYKTVVFPLRQTKEDKRRKFIEYGQGQSQDDGALLDDKADENAEIESTTVDKLIEYYGHWSKLVVFIAYHAFLSALKAYSAYLIGEWAQDKTKQTDPEKFKVHVTKIFATVLFIALFEIAKERMTFLIICNTLKRVHDDVVERIMMAPVNLFFDTTPNGTIMKRFSEDMQVIEHLIRATEHCVWLFIDLTATFVMLGYSNPQVFLVLPPLLIYIKYIYDFTLKAKRQAIQILQSSGNPIDNHQNEVMSGTSSIRAMGAEDHAVNTDADNQNAHLLAQQVSFATFVWYATRLMFASSATTVLTGNMCLFSKFSGGDTILASMAFEKVVHMGYKFNGLVQIAGDFEKKLASIQKCFKLLTIPQEITGQPKVTGTWPTRGKIEFKDVELKYRPTTELVLKKLTVSIKGGEKVGVVGRTGAGKSTITLALTRIIEICGGQILVDGIDINKHEMNQLRNKITIIPQEPTLFKGSLRYNLDPLNTCKDEDITALLKESGIEELILKKKKEDEEKKKQLEAGLSAEELAMAKDDQKVEDQSLLNFQVQPGGANLSSGEKSLICICRAVLRKNKIVILDEATANIDIVTEQTIQKLIKKNFKDCTMITVAHRLQTIIESDKVLVLDKGRVAEFDAPNQLLKNPESHFTKLVNQMQEEEGKK